MASPKLPGKTSPRIFNDILFRDSKSNSVHNPFKDFPPGFHDLDFIPENNTSTPKCHHRYTIKLGQTMIEPIAPNRLSQKVSAICQNCLWHIDVILEWKNDLDALNSCPSSEHPLHHFVKLDDNSKNKHPIEYYAFTCTVCHVNLNLCLRPKRLTADYHTLLIDPANLQDRYEKAMRKDPERQNVEVQTPLRVLEALSAYLRDALNETTETRKIPIQNKRFMTSFGDDCDVLLEWLGFRQISQEDASGIHRAWSPPKLPPRNPLDTAGKRVLLEDVMEELYATMRRIISKQSLYGNVKQKVPETRIFDYDLKMLLGMFDYERMIPKNKRTDLSQDYLYAGLGATQDFTPELLLYAFRRQITWDESGTTYYYDCLRQIAYKLSNDQLMMEIAMLASQGYVTKAEIKIAYKHLGFQNTNFQSITDEDVLGHFESRLESTHKSYENELREKLKLIGQARGSQLLMNAAENNIQNAEQALKWLDSTYDGRVSVSDDHIIAMAVSKQSEKPEQIEFARKAVSILAEERDSATLRSWLTGSADDWDHTDDLGAAYFFFNIQDRTAVIDPTVLESVVAYGISEHPEKEAEYRKHFDMLINHHPGETRPLEIPPDYENPVGLNNMGNTCYLNSLLQFFYAVKPLREMILDFSSYQIDITSSTYKPKKVDSQEIPKPVVKQSQDFAKELRGLFVNMASGPGPVVRPSWILAAKLFERAPVSVMNHRRSTIGGEGPYITSPTRSIGSLARFPDLSSNPLYSNHSARSSTVTLIDEEPQPISEKEGNAMVLDDKSALLESPSGSDKVPLLEDESDYSQTSSAIDRSDALSHPPPIPPRPIIGPLLPQTNEDDKDKVSKAAAEAAALQQDVDEAMGNVLFKLQCSIQDTTIDNQSTDPINELFYGHFVWKYLNKTAEDNDEAFSAINVTLDTKPVDIDAGLDSAFAIDEVALGGKTIKRHRTLTKLPPIFQIYIQRQYYDPEKQDAVINKHHINLNEVIYLDRFMAVDSSPIQELRKRAWSLDENLQKLNSERDGLEKTPNPNLDGPDLLDRTYEFISSNAETISADSALQQSILAQIEARRSDITAVKDEITTLDQERKSLFSTHHERAYRLAAVFVHRGQGGSRGGHYWVHVKDFRENKWRRYEDSDVSEVKDLNEIFGKTDPSTTGAPYFCVYVQDDQREKLIDAVYRDKPDALMHGGDEDEIDEVNYDEEDDEDEAGFNQKPTEPLSTMGFN